MTILKSENRCSRNILSDNALLSHIIGLISSCQRTENHAWNIYNNMLKSDNTPHPLPLPLPPHTPVKKKRRRNKQTPKHILKHLQLRHARDPRLSLSRRTTLTQCLLVIIYIWVTEGEIRKSMSNFNKMFVILCNLVKLHILFTSWFLLAFSFPLRWFNPIISNKLLEVSFIIILHKWKLRTSIQDNIKMKYR